MAIRPYGLPINNCIYNSLLLAGSTPEIDTSGLNTFMSHKVGKERKVIEAL